MALGKSQGGQESPRERSEAKSTAEVIISLLDMDSSGPKREVNTAAEEGSDNNMLGSENWSRSKPQRSSLGTDLNTGDLQTTQGKPNCHGSASQSEMSVDDGNADLSSKTKASSPGELGSTSKCWPDDKTGDTSSGAHSMDLNTLIISSLEGLTQDIDGLSLNTDELCRAANLVVKASNNTTDESLREELQLKLRVLRLQILKVRISRTSGLKTFFEQFEKTARSGSRNDLMPLVLHADYRLVIARSENGLGEDVIPPLSLEDLKAVVDDTSRDFDDLLAVVEDISSCNFGRPGDPRPENRSILLTSNSMTPFGTLGTKSMVFHWVLSRQMGLLRPDGVNRVRILCPTDRDSRLNRRYSNFQRLRGAHNIKGRWYSISHFRVLVTKAFDLLRKERTRFSGPLDPSHLFPPLPSDYDMAMLRIHFIMTYRDWELAYHLSATAWCNMCAKHAMTLVTAYKELCGSSFDEAFSELNEVYHAYKDNDNVHENLTRVMLRFLKSKLPGSWQEIRDSSGRQCWVDHKFHSFTYQEPRKENTEGFVHAKRMRKMCIISSKIPMKPSRQVRNAQETTSRSELDGMPKSGAKKMTSKPASGLNPSNKRRIFSTASTEETTKAHKDSQIHQQTQLVPEENSVPGLGPDKIDQCCILLTATPEIANMLCYFSEEDWFKEQDNADYGPLPRSRVPTRTLLKKLIKELKALRNQ